MSNHAEKNWKRADFSFAVPAELIAQFPARQRQSSRLLVIAPDTEQSVTDKQFTDFSDFLQPNDVLVMNDTRVIPARLSGNKATGGKVEVLVERIIDEQHVLAHVRASKSPKAGTALYLEETIQAEVLEREGDLFKIRFFPEDNVLNLLDKYGHMPLPPYIERQDQAQDQDRYQTVYAKHAGAVAAPTAGLHLTTEMLAGITAKGVELATVTLHVGAGTFQPVRENDLSKHKMHSEWMRLSSDVVTKINTAKANGGRVIAVGTTSVRCLETAALEGALTSYTGDTDIFITPGFEFKVVDALLTNFHLSESTLMMLVSAFAGYTNIKQAYQHAIEQRYRFFSYGDAMFITNRIKSDS